MLGNHQVGTCRRAGKADRHTRRGNLARASSPAVLSHRSIWTEPPRTGGCRGLRTAAALRIWKPPGDGGLPSTSWSSPRAVRAATLRRRGSARHIPFQKPESRKTPADGADPHHTRRRKGRLPAPPRKTEKTSHPGSAKTRAPATEWRGWDGKHQPGRENPARAGVRRHAQRRYRDRLGKPRTDGGVPQEVLELQHGKPQPRKTGAEPGIVSRETPASPAPCDGGETTEPGPVCAHRNGAAPPPGAASSVPRDHES